VLAKLQRKKPFLGIAERRSANQWGRNMIVELDAKRRMAEGDGPLAREVLICSERAGKGQPILVRTKRSVCVGWGWGGRGVG